MNYKKLQSFFINDKKIKTKVSVFWLAILFKQYKELIENILKMTITRMNLMVLHYLIKLE